MTFLCFVIVFSLTVNLILKSNNATQIYSEFGFRDCSIRTIVTIVDPFPQNVSDIITKATCEFYQHLPNELIIKDRPEDLQGELAATIIFSLLFVWLLVTYWRQVIVKK